MGCVIDDCGAPVRARGWCTPHYERWRKYGGPTDGGTSRGAPRAFLERAIRPDTTECIVWPYVTNQKGYGRLVVDGRLWLAHRVAWKLATGIDPGGMCVLHLCDNPPCVNPGHLVLGTNAANTFDMMNKGRGRKAVA